MTGNSNEESPDMVTDPSDKNIANDHEWQTGYIKGNTFDDKEVRYKIVNDMAICQGDIILAKTPEQLEKLSQKPVVPSEHEPPAARRSVKALVKHGDELRWPRGEIPYVIQPTLPNQDRVKAAIAHWEFYTPIRFIPRTNSNAQNYPNYVSFIQYIPKQDERQEEIFHCSSPIGMQNWGEQNIIISDQCVAGDVIHEIGHTVGLWHEQGRSDRDKYIRILTDNINHKDIHNFDKHFTDGDDVGEYDYCSTMHYGTHFFSKGQGLATIEPIKPLNGCVLGQKNGLSNGDIAAVVSMYGDISPTVLQNPSNGRLEVFMVAQDSKPSGGPPGATKPILRKQQASQNDSSNWDSQWDSLAHGLFTAGLKPTIRRNTDNTLEVFSVSSNNLHYSYQSTPNGQILQGSMSNSRNVGHFGDPVVGRDADGMLEVFFVGNDSSQQIYYARQTSSSSHTLDMFVPLGGYGSPNRKLTVGQNADNRLEVFVLASNNQLYYRWQKTASNKSQWNDDGWVPLGGPLLDDPVVARNADGRLELFAVFGNNRTLCHRWQTTRVKDNTGKDTDKWNWSDGWDGLGGYWSVRNTPAVALNAEGRLEVFMVGKNQQLYHTWQTSRDSSTGKADWFTEWEVLEKRKKNDDGTTQTEKWPLSSNPTVGRNANGTLDVFMIDKDGVVNHKWQTTKNNNTGRWEWSDDWAQL
jgi:astacin